MSPSKFHHASKDVATSVNGYNWVPPPLKISKASHSIKKSSPSPPSSSSSSSSRPPPPPPAQHRQPVIIYTHSPKVIHTQPKDFMALVQKLTGLSHPDDEDDDNNNKTKPETGNSHAPSTAPPPPVKTAKPVAGDDEAASEECGMSSCSSGRNNHGGPVRMNPCGLMNNMPVFGPRSGDFFCPNQAFYSYNNPFLYGSSSLRSSHVPSSPSTVLLEGLKEVSEY